MTTTELKALKIRWNHMVAGKAGDVDPQGFYCWQSMLVGYLIGAGMDHSEAEVISLEATRFGWKYPALK